MGHDVQPLQRQTVLAMETKFAEATLDNVELRDPAATDHNTTFAQLQAMAPHFDWAGYFKHKQLPTDVDINVDQPKFIQEVDRQMQQTSLADWKTYLKWQLLDSVANSLSAPFVEENFAFNGKYLAGADRDEAALEAVRGIVGPPAGRGARQEICREIFPARSQGTHAGDGQKSSGGDARRHPEPQLDER